MFFVYLQISVYLRIVLIFLLNLLRYLQITILINYFYLFQIQ